MKATTRDDIFFNDILSHGKVLNALILLIVWAQLRVKERDSERLARMVQKLSIKGKQKSV